MKNIIFTISVLFSFALNAQDQMFDICPIKNSEEIPASQVFSKNGDTLNLKELISEKPTVLVFYRGGWCPYCTKHLSALGEAKDKIDSLGYGLVAITPDSFEKLDSSVVRAGEIDYTLLSDKNASAINDFGISWKVDDRLYHKYKTKYGLDMEWWSGSNHHLLPVPAVFIIKGGKIIYQHVNPDYSKRLSTKVLLSFLE